MKLINATPSPYGRKVAISLMEKGISYDVQYDVPWTPETCVGAYSPLRQLPILLTDEGQAIYDSAYILDWLELRYPEPALLPANVDARLAAMLVRLLAERLVEITAVIGFEVRRPEPSRQWLARQRHKISSGTAELSRLIGERAPATSDTIHLGDIAAGCALRLFDFVAERDEFRDIFEFSWRSQHVNLVRYAAALEARPSFVQTQPVMFDADLKQTVA